MASRVKRVLLVGGGPTATMAAKLICESPHGSNVSVTLWDKARRAGGRVNTTHARFSEAVSADLGAQYFSLREDAPVSVERAFSELVADGVLTPMSATVEGMQHKGDSAPPKHYVAPRGARAVVTHALEAAERRGASAVFGRRVAALHPVGADKWRASAEDGVEEDFDAVLVTVPAPQALGIRGDGYQAALDRPAGPLDAAGLSAAPAADAAPAPTLRALLEGVRYSSRYALALFYRDGAALDGAGAWGGRYVSGDPCVRYLSRDHAKRGAATDQGCSLVVHTSVPYGLQHLEESNEAVEADIHAAARRLIPSLPASPDGSRLIRWRFSQVNRPATGHGQAYAAAPAEGSPTAPIIFAGTAFTEGNYPGAVVSASAAAHATLHALRLASPPKL